MRSHIFEGQNIDGNFEEDRDGAEATTKQTCDSRGKWYREEGTG